MYPPELTSQDLTYAPWTEPFLANFTEQAMQVFFIIIVLVWLFHIWIENVGGK